VEGRRRFLGELVEAGGGGDVAVQVGQLQDRFFPLALIDLGMEWAVSLPEMQSKAFTAKLSVSHSRFAG
jgi:hypothetical protein